MFKSSRNNKKASKQSTRKYSFVFPPQTQSSEEFMTSNQESNSLHTTSINEEVCQEKEAQLEWEFLQQMIVHASKLGLM